MTSYGFCDIISERTTEWKIFEVSDSADPLRETFSAVSAVGDNVSLFWSKKTKERTYFSTCVEPLI